MAGWAEEIVIVLNEEVQDETENIATEFGATVYREPWKGHIEQKNTAAAKATLDWSLGLDSDEVASIEMMKEIRNIVSSVNSQRAACYSFPRCTEYAGKMIRHGDWYPDRQTRLWKTGTAKWGGTNPHDKLISDGVVVKLSGEILHYSMDSFDHQIQKYMRYADDFAREAQKNGRLISLCELFFRPSWRFFRGYFLKRGFMDGWQGLTIARMTSFYTFIRYIKAYEAQSSGGQK